MRPTAPLLVSADPALISEVHRLAAAAGVVPDVADTVAGALHAWGSAPVVLVGQDLAPQLAAYAPARREQVHVIAAGTVADTLFRDALGIGAETVTALPASDAWLVELLTDAGDGTAEPGTLTAVIGGSGGAGATIFATALAQAMAERTPTLLVDADPLGAGLDRVLALETAEGIRWDALMQTTGRLSSRSLREALPRSGALSVLAWPQQRPGVIQPFAVREVLSAGRRGFGAVVLDLPRQADPVVEEIVSRCDHLVLMVHLTVPGVTAAARIAQRLPAGGPTRHLVTRGDRTGVTPESASKLLRVPLLAAMSAQRGLDEAVNLGAGPVRSRRSALGRAARAGADRLLPPAPTVAA